MKIAIIDNGVAENIISNKLISFKCYNGKISKNYNNITSKYSHGTMCAQLALRKVQKKHTVFSLAISSEFSDAIEKDMLCALNWCLENDIDIINISNGAECYFNNEEINDLCYRLWEKGTITIAALSNDWKYTVPACLPYVVSVSNHRFPFSKYFAYISSDVRKNGYFRFYDRKRSFHIESQNSFSCAKVCNSMIKKHDNISQINGFQKKIYDYSLLKNVLILENDIFIKDLLCFPFQTYLKGQKIRDKSTFVISPCFPQNYVIENISCNAKKIGLIVWCDYKIPMRIRRWCKKNKIMCTSLTKIFESTIVNLNKSETDSFVIVLNELNSSLDSMNLLINLKQNFIKDGYNTLAFSSENYCELYGCFKVKKAKNISGIIRNISPDVAIILAKDINKVKWDICVSIEKGSLQIITSDSNHILTTASNLYADIINLTKDDDFVEEPLWMKKTDY